MSTRRSAFALVTMALAEPSPRGGNRVGLPVDAVAFLVAGAGFEPATSGL